VAMGPPLISWGNKPNCHHNHTPRELRSDAGDTWFTIDDLEVSNGIPEPTSLPLLGLGLAGLGFTRNPRR
jgi:hypothetical protein